MRTFAYTVSLALLFATAYAAPLKQAHAHNDYEHERPLLDALEHGFSSVEADVWLVGGKLLVAHDEDEVTPERTLEALYLGPLEQRVAANGGTVYAGSDLPLTLLIDIKSDAAPTYRALDAALRAHSALLTRFAGEKTEKGAVTTIVSGNRPLELMASQAVRFAGYDGRLTDLGTDAPASLIPLISDNWTDVFIWMGAGAMPDGERAELERIVGEAHAKGRSVRFWETPDEPGRARTALWRELERAGVDHINTDDLEGLETFLRAHGAD